MVAHSEKGKGLRKEGAALSKFITRRDTFRRWQVSSLGRIRGWQAEDSTRVWGTQRWSREWEDRKQRREAEGLGLMQDLESYLRAGLHAASHQGIVSEL